MSKTNEMFIKTLLICGKLDPIKKDILDDVIDVISNSDVDIAHHYNYIKKLYERDSDEFGEIVGILVPAYIVIKYQQQYFEDYTKLVSERLKITTDRDLKYIVTFFGHNKRLLQIAKDLKLWKIQEVRGLEKLKLNNEIVTLGLIKDENGAYIQQVDNKGKVIGKYTAIKIKNGNIKTIKEDNLKMMDILLKGDYDLILIPSMNLTKENIWKNYDTSQMTNEEFLEYIMILKRLIIGKEDIKNEYINLCNSKYDLKKILGLMIKWKALNTNYTIIFISEILDRIKDFEKENAKDVLNQIYRTMYIRINNVKYTDINKTHEKLIKGWITVFRNKDLKLEECLNEFKIDNSEYVYAIRGSDDIIYDTCKENEIRVMDHKVCKDIVENAVIVVENGGRKTVLDKVKQKDLYTDILKKNNIDLIVDTQWEEL